MDVVGTVPAAAQLLVPVLVAHVAADTQRPAVNLVDVHPVDVSPADAHLADVVKWRLLLAVLSTPPKNAL